MATRKAVNVDGASGEVKLAPGLNGVGTKWPTTWRPLCRVVRGERKCRTLRVSVLYDSLGSAFYAGDSDQLGAASPALADAAVLKIELGENAQRTLYADLRSGDFVLPPSDTVYVSVARYAPANSIVGQGDALIAGELCDDDAQDFSPLVKTSWGLLAFGASATVRVPAGAYAYDIESEAEGGTGGTDWTYAGANGPIFEVTQGPSYALRDYKSNVFIPGATPMPLVWGRSPVTGTTLAIKNQAAAGTHVLKVAFYIR